MGMTNRSTLRRPVTPESSVFCSTEVREREELEEIVTDQLLLRHPRALLMLSCVQMCLGVKISVFGLICRVYDGCPLATPVWGGCVLSATGLLGLVFVKVWSRRQVLLILIIASVLSVIVSFGLFVQTTLALEAEESRLKGRWNYIQQSYVDINRIVENTKIAMWALELVLTPIEVVCFMASLILDFINLRLAHSDVSGRRAYYVAPSRLGHQMLLIPVSLKTRKPVKGRIADDRRNDSLKISVETQTVGDLTT